MLKIAYFLNKVGYSLDFIKIPNSNTLCIKYAKYSTNIIFYSSYTDYNMKYVLFYILLAQTGSESHI